MLASRKNGTLYVGLTNNLHRRLEQHRSGGSTFTATYEVFRLVYYEELPDRESARQRERTLKDWDRAWKIDLIEKLNPDWNDLAHGIPYD